MEAQPDVQLGKIFIVLWMGLMLFIIISVIIVYFNAKSEASDCDPKELNTEKSEKKSDSPTPKLFIAFLVITAFAVSTMNLTYKVNYFKKKTEETESGPASPSKLLGIISNATGNTSQNPNNNPENINEP
jgi:heme/copper-type cytochrome/quinol oxidase subunit 2